MTFFQTDVADSFPGFVYVHRILDLVPNKMSFGTQWLLSFWRALAYLSKLVVPQERIRTPRVVFFSHFTDTRPLNSPSPSALFIMLHTISFTTATSGKSVS